MINQNLEFSKKFQQLVGSSSRILITSHTNPDDDSIASVLATFYFLKKFNPEKNIEIIYSGEKVSR